jgi:hypothetical protein
MLCPPTPLPRCSLALLRSPNPYPCRSVHLLSSYSPFTPLPLSPLVQSCLIPSAPSASPRASEPVSPLDLPNHTIITLSHGNRQTETASPLPVFSVLFCCKVWPVRIPVTVWEFFQPCYQSYEIFFFFFSPLPTPPRYPYRGRFKVGSDMACYCCLPELVFSYVGTLPRWYCHGS